MSYTTQQETLRNFVLYTVPKCFLPAIQRELVWDTERIENLFDSIVRGYPFGTLLIWKVRTDALRKFSFYKLIDDFDAEWPHNEKATLFGQEECLGILDGQQRTTALRIGLKGSYRDKKPYKRRNNPEAWVKYKLYMNLLYKPEQGDDRRYEFKFLDEASALQNDAKHWWFRAGQILDFKDENELRAWRRSTEQAANLTFEDNLGDFWKAITRIGGISYFEEDNQELDEVLTIFVRLNMGGQTLSYSDLLLSLATATWKEIDAREAVYLLVEKLNKECGRPFSFDKDIVLKALLVLEGGDVRFRTENIRNDRDLEGSWKRVAQAMPMAVRLAAQFGLSRETLTATNALIPIAYYLDKIGASESYLGSKQTREDRSNIRRWLMAVLIGRVFGRQSDQILTALRKKLQEQDPSTGFPANLLLTTLRESQALAITREAIETLVDETRYGSPQTYLLLTLLRPASVEAAASYHVDHLHPHAHFDSAHMNAAGWTSEQQERAKDDRDRLPNLQLLEGTSNTSKNATPLDSWLKGLGPSGADARQLALIPADADCAFSAFPIFFAERRKNLIERLCESLLKSAVNPGPIG